MCKLNTRKNELLSTKVPHTRFFSLYYSSKHAIASEAAVAMSKPRGWVKTSKWCRGMREQMAAEQERKCPGRCRRGKEAGRMHSQNTCGSDTHLLSYIKKCLTVLHVCLGLPDLTHSLQTQTETQ